MKTLRQQHEDLTKLVYTTYNDLITKLGETSFYKNIDEDELYDCEIVTYITNNGNNIDAHVLKISEEGIFIAEYEDDSERYFIDIQDVASLSDKITIVELLQIEDNQNIENDKLIERMRKASE